MAGRELNPDFVEGLARLEVARWDGGIWRYTFGNQPPERTNTRGARWNPPGIEALYSSLDEATATAEVDHIARMQPIPPTAGRNLHYLHASLEAVVDLSSPRNLAELGVSVESVTADDWSICQAIGAAASFLGLDGLLVPSARAIGKNLVIFFSGTDAGPSIELVRSRELPGR